MLQHCLSLWVMYTIFTLHVLVLELLECSEVLVSHLALPLPQLGMCGLNLPGILHTQLLLFPAQPIQFLTEKTNIKYNSELFVSVQCVL